MDDMRRVMWSHTDEILNELGYTDPTIAALRERGIV